LSKQNQRYTNPTELSTIIGPDAVVIGEIKAKATIRVDGKIEGNVDTTANLTIGKDGEVVGDINAKDIVVGGKIAGRLIASGKVILEAKSTLNGDLKTSRLIVEEGATFNGRSDMGGGGGTQYQGKTLQLDES